MNDTSQANVKLEASYCPLGCTGGDELVLNGRDRRQDLPGEFSVVRCLYCRLMRTDPRPTLDTIDFYYPEDYGPYHDTKATIRPKRPLRRSFLKDIARNLFQFNTCRLPVLEPGRMLEIGCASGAFMHHMAQQGWDVVGIEPSQSASENTRVLGYPVYTGAIETAPTPEAAYDLVVAWMVLEHVHRPVLALQRLHKWTKSEGWLVLSVPNAGSLEFKLFKHTWYALHLPNHLYHYTPKTLCNILKKCGWEIKRLYHQRHLFNLFPSIGYALSDIGVKNIFTDWLIDFPKRGWKRHYFMYPASYVLGALGQTGRMTIWARKAND